MGETCVIQVKMADMPTHGQIVSHRPSSGARGTTVIIGKRSTKNEGSTDRSSCHLVTASGTGVTLTS